MQPPRHVLIAPFDGPLFGTLYPVLLDCDTFEVSRIDLTDPMPASSDFKLADIFVALLSPSFDDFGRLEKMISKLPPGVPSVSLLSDNCVDVDLSRAASYTDEAFYAGLPESVPNVLIAALQDHHGIDESALQAALDAVGIFSCDPVFLSQIRTLPRIAQFESPVLVLGETGTGKDLCARLLHHLRQDRKGPFVAVDCGAIPDHLIENELFGHGRGAYTDARNEFPGLVGHADGGTLFLDEIDGLSLVAQSKLLRFLQESTYRPLGTTSSKRADVRVVAATNSSLESKVEQNLFRRDLFYRLNVLRVELPPLRERKRDICPLLELFLRSGANPQDATLTLTDATRSLLETYDWPGNVRELYNAAQKMKSFVRGCLVKPMHVRAAIPQLSDSDDTAPDGPDRTLKEMKFRLVSDFERDYVARLLEKSRGNVSQAARAAGKERKAFSRLMKKYGVRPAVLETAKGAVKVGQ